MLSIFLVSQQKYLKLEEVSVSSGIKVCFKGREIGYAKWAEFLLPFNNKAKGKFFPMNESWVIFCLLSIKKALTNPDPAAFCITINMCRQS